MPQRIWDDVDYDELVEVIEVYGEMNGAKTSKAKPMDELDRGLIARERAKLAQTARSV